MDRHVAITKLQAHADTVRDGSVVALFIRSTARDEATAGSDLDIYIDYDRASRFNAFDLVGIKQFLEAELGAPVDVTTRDGLHPRLRERIEHSAMRIF